MAKDAHEKQEGGKKLQWFFFVIVIPFVFAITLALIIFTLLGFNVFEQAEKYASKLPVVSQVVSNEEENPGEEQVDRTDQLQASLADRSAEIKQLQQEVDNKQTTIAELEEQIKELEVELAANSESGEAETNKVTELAVSFQEMDPEEAAPIIGNMNETLAVQVLEEVPGEERGEILGQMEPEKAASLVSSFLGSPANN